MRNMKLGIVITATNRAGAALGAVEKRIDSIRRHSMKVGKSMTALGAKFTAGGVAMGYSIAKLVGSYEEVARAQGEIASLDIGASGIAKISREAQRFSNEFAGTTKAQFIRASYDIKSGIASLSDDGVAKFTRLAAITAAATKSSTEQMTKLFALGYGIFRPLFKSDIDFGDKFSAAIGAAVKAFRTDGNDLVAGLSTLGAVATKAGYSLEEQLAVLGVSKSAFNTASEAATSYRAFINGAGKAQKELGLRFTDSKGRLLSMSTILKKIKQKYGDLSKKSVQDKLKKAFGSDEAVKILLALIDKTKDLDAATRDLHSSMEKGSAVTEEMAKKMQRGKEFELARQRIGNLAAQIGAVFAPTVLRMTGYLGEVVTRLQDWIAANPKAARTIGTVGVAVTGALLGLGALGTAVGMASFAFGGLMTLLSPVVAGIAAIGVAGYLLIRDWDQVKTFWIGVWNDFKAKVGEAAEWIKATAMKPISAIVGAWQGFKTWFSGLFPNAAAAIGRAWDAIGKAIAKPVEWVKAQWEELFAWFSRQFKKIADKFSWIGKGLEKVKSIGSKIGDAVSGAVHSVKSFVVGDTPKDKTPARVVGTAVKRVAVASAVAASPATVSATPVAQPVQTKQVQHNERFVYNVHVTVNGSTITPEDVKAAVDRAMRDAQYHHAQRTMSDM